MAWLLKTAMQLRDKKKLIIIFLDLDWIGIVGLTIQIHLFKLDCQSQSNPTKRIAIRIGQSTNQIQQYPGQMSKLQITNTGAQALLLSQAS